MSSRQVRQWLVLGRRHLTVEVALIAVSASTGLSVGCAERLGQKAAEGAMTTMRQQAATRQGPPPAQVAAARAVEGAMNALDDPAQQARIQRMVAQAVAAATRTVIKETSHELMIQLGPHGAGPLGASLAQASQRVSASVAGGVAGGVGTELAALVPECSGPNRVACLEQRLQQATRTTAATFSKGVRDSIGWQFLVLAFVLGAIGGALGSWLWSLRAVRHRWRTA